MNTWNERLAFARESRNIKKSAFARLVGVSAPTATHWESGEITKIDGTNLMKVCEVLRISPSWLMNGSGNMDATGTSDVPSYGLVSADNTDLNVGHIPYWDAKGSCGGGFLNYEQQPKGLLVKENTFFQRYNLKPENAFAIYADGNSMADFIVDGDIVIFDKSFIEPQNGKIYAIDHPDGLRIKRLRRMIDGAWALESTNPDKRLYPDEIITPDHMELLKIHGKFVYRQGG